MMEELSEFLIKNYIWFLLIAVVLLFALIGYIVDTNAKKNPKPAKVDKNTQNTKQNVNKLVSVEVNKNVPLNTLVNKKEEANAGENSTKYDAPIIKEEESKNNFEIINEKDHLQK